MLVATLPVVSFSKTFASRLSAASVVVLAILPEMLDRAAEARLATVATAPAKGAAKVEAAAPTPAPHYAPYKTDSGLG